MLHYLQNKKCNWFLALRLLHNEFCNQLSQSSCIVQTGPKLVKNILKISILAICLLAKSVNKNMGTWAVSAHGECHNIQYRKQPE